ncbi:hypothetical protein HNQ56_000323 [Anaerotaenia torta]|uniref:hypothetical protein n=1 Tax=Anaerotaenia torta TaxID=433293 RepID=UPI003D1EFCA3
MTNNANGIVTADAVKLVYLDDFSYDDIEAVNISTDKNQLAIGETAGLTVTGVDGAGRQLDLVFDGAQVEYVVDNPGVAAVDHGVVTGLAKGTTFLSAGINLSGRQITSDSVVDLAVELTLPEDLTGHYMKVYLWDSLATLRPLADVTIWP